MGAKDYPPAPLPKKLGMNDCSRVTLVDAPSGLRRTLTPLPPGVAVTERATSEALDVMVAFATAAAKLAGSFARLKRSLAPAGGLWVAYPKKSSGAATDLTFEEWQRTGPDD